MPCVLPKISITSCIFSGDGDFRSLVAALQQMGKRVSVVSTLQTQPPMVADELRRQADQFVDLADLEQLICRDPATRPVREGRLFMVGGGRGGYSPREAGGSFQDNDDLSEEV